MSIGKIGPYRIEEWLGQGGMGRVCRAYDQRLDRRVAIKRIRSKALADYKVRERFRREARLAASLNHPAIVQIYDVLEEEESDWIVMEHIEGQTLAQLLADGGFELALGLTVLRDVAEGLAEAHAQGIVHRDVKATNVMVTARGRGKILDFGLARPFLPAKQTTVLTVVGTVLGTPHAMSPEQVQGEDLDHRSDLFSLGTLLYEVATGDAPFRAATPVKTLTRVCTHSPPAPAALVPGLPPALSELALQLLEKDPAARPGSATEVAAALTRLLAGGELARTPAPPRPRRPAGSRPAADEDTPSTAGFLPQSRTASAEPWQPAVQAPAFASVAHLPPIGRAAELARLGERWDDARAGVGQVVLLTGPPGIGKSHLAQRLLERATADGTALVCRCRPHEEETPFAPVTALLRALLPAPGADGTPSGATALTALLRDTGLPLKVALPLFAELLALPVEPPLPPARLSAAGRRRLTLQSLCAFFLELAGRRPLALLVEDFDCADPSTAELFSLLVRRSATARTLLLFTLRPGAEPPWQSSPRLTSLALAPLTRDEAAALAGAVGGGEQLPAPVVARIVERAGGVPLLVEELARAAAEGGARDAAGVPPDLARALAVRLDRLGGAREVAQQASVLGSACRRDLLAATVGFPEAALARHLAALRAAGVLRWREDGGAASDPRIEFRHTLLQDAVYRSLRADRRRRLHAAAAAALVERFPETAAARPELLARHCALGDDPPRAVALWHAAGSRAHRAAADCEAAACFRRGRDLLAALAPSAERDRWELACCTDLGSALIAAGGYGAPEVAAVYGRARQLVRGAVGSPELRQVQSALFVYDYVRADLDQAARLAQEMLATAESERLAPAAGQAHHALAACAVSRGDLEAARLHLERALAAADAPEPAFTFGHDPRVMSRALLALDLWLLGAPEDARRESGEGLARARQLDHPYSTGVALLFAAVVNVLRGEPIAVLRRTGELLALAEEQVFPWLTAYADVLAGWARVARALPEEAAAPAVDQDPAVAEGLAQMRRGLEGMSRLGFLLRRPFLLALFAEACLRCHRLDDARTALAEAQERYERTGERFWEAEIARLAGELLRRDGDAEVAESAYERAAAIAHRQQASSLELRAVLSLAHLRRARGRHGEARDAVRSVCARFTEESDAPELRRARALLTEAP